MMRTKLTSERLREVIVYDPESGVFTWKSRGSPRFDKRFSGREAGALRPNGYIQINIDSVIYLAHRLAWLYMTGEWPNDCIDHKDMQPSNNKFSNLRLATKAQNQRFQRKPSHNTSGFKGVSFNKVLKKWTAKISIENKTRYIGSFETPEEAHSAYLAEAVRLSGDFAHPG